MAPHTPNIGHRDEIHQLCATTLEAIHEADKLLFPHSNVVNIERQSLDEDLETRDSGVRTRGGGVRTRGTGVRTRGGGVHTRGDCVWIEGGSTQTHGGQISHDQHFHTNDTSLPSIDEGVIQEDVGTSFIQEVL